MEENKSPKSFKNRVKAKSFKKSTPYKAGKKTKARRLIQNNDRDNYNDNDYTEQDPIELEPLDEGLDDDIVNPKGKREEDLLVDDEFINEINDAVEEELFEEEIDF